MEDVKIKEDLDTIGEPATEDEIDDAKKLFIKKGLGEKDLELDNLNSDQLDGILGKMYTNINEKCDQIIKYSLKEKLNVVEQLQKFIGFKENEAENVYFDYLTENRMKEAENAEILKVKDKEEILMFNEPEADVSIGKNIFEVGKVDHCEDLEKQKGKDLGKYKIEGIK